MSQIEITPEIEKISKEVLDIMTKRHHNGISAMGLMSDLMKRHEEMDVCKALSFLGSNKLINLNSSIGTHATLQYFELLDEDGTPIKNTMIGDESDPEDFGIVYYYPKDKLGYSTTCFEHLDEQVEKHKMKVAPECLKCFQESAERICLEHNQSLEFCKLCRIRARDNFEQGKIEGFDVVWQKIKNKHHKEYWAN